MAAWNLSAEVVSWIAQLASVLHRRIAWRLLPLMVGALFGQGRQTGAFSAGGLGMDFDIGPAEQADRPAATGRDYWQSVQ